MAELWAVINQTMEYLTAMLSPSTPFIAICKKVFDPNMGDKRKVHERFFEWAAGDVPGRLSGMLAFRSFGAIFLRGFCQLHRMFPQSVEIAEATRDVTAFWAHITTAAKQEISLARHRRIVADFNGRLWDDYERVYNWLCVNNPDVSMSDILTVLKNPLRLVRFDEEQFARLLEGRGGSWPCGQGAGQAGGAAEQVRRHRTGGTAARTRWSGTDGEGRRGRQTEYMEKQRKVFLDFLKIHRETTSKTRMTLARECWAIHRKEWNAAAKKGIGYSDYRALARAKLIG